MEPGPQQTGVADLEGRLSGMILRNAGGQASSSQAVHQSYADQAPSGMPQGPLPAGVRPPPGFRNPGVLEPSPKTKPKRLNQAERRKMSAQLTIPINPRPTQPTSPFGQSSRGHAGSPAYPHHQHSHSNQLGGPSADQRPHSATFHPPSRGAGPHGPGSAPYGRHQPSLSYQGPISTGHQPSLANQGPASAGHQPPLSYRDPASAGHQSSPSYQGPVFAGHQPSLSYQGPTSAGHRGLQQPQGAMSAGHHGWQPPQGPHGWQLPPGSHDWQLPHPFRGSQRPDQNAFYGPASPIPPIHGSRGPVGADTYLPPWTDDMTAQAELLERLCNTVIVGAEIERGEIGKKEAFRARIEAVARQAIFRHEIETNDLTNFDPASVQLKCFGSLASGFATKDADMDLGLFSPQSLVQPDASGSPIPRLVEKAFLDMGLGARLLSRTRVPIIKVCENPTPTLRADLLAARAKWESSGLQEEAEEDEDHEELDSFTTTERTPQSGQELDEKTSATADHHLRGKHTGSPPAVVSQTEQGLRALQQGNRSLASYYGYARGLLRKLKGRDITSSNAVWMNETELRLLNELALAFVENLADNNLKSRLLSYKSLDRKTLLNYPNYRSFQGVYSQVEGEALVVAWDSREVMEKEMAAEKRAQDYIAAWKTLCNKSSFGLNPVGYAKDLETVVAQLKQFPSIRLMILSQSQSEPASGYFRRANKLRIDLGGLENSAVCPIVKVMIRKYIQGIAIKSVRHGVEAFVNSEPRETLSLPSIGTKHKALELAYEFEMALAQGLYPPEDAQWVERYIQILRGPLAKLTGGRDCQRIVPLPGSSQEKLEFMSNIKRIGDPALLWPNRPREAGQDRLQFPKSGVGVQCDINFSAHLAIQNTLLLRCYSHCDPRVRPMVLFVKHWAKVRRINSTYRGTLSSYGYVLMVLHYLVNIAQPFVLPNLQTLAAPPDPTLTPAQRAEATTCKGYNIEFWKDEEEIQRLARENALTQNHESLGQLLRGFFEYYTHTSYMTTAPIRGFQWATDVLSLRTPGGLLTKHDKGWVGAKTIVEVHPTGMAPAPGPSSSTPLEGSTDAANSPRAQREEFKEVRLRYLLAIEDPFELDHNVGRTVTHSGLNLIREEFRRAWRLIKAAGGSRNPEDLLLADADDEAARGGLHRSAFAALVNELHR